jgi:hypothetical protein
MKIPKFPLFSKKKLISLFVFLLLVGVIVEIWTSNRLATLGTQLITIEKSRDDLSLENELLQIQIARWESIDRTEKYAGLLGFSKINNITYIQTASGSATSSQ